MESNNHAHMDNMYYVCVRMLDYYDGFIIYVDDYVGNEMMMNDYYLSKKIIYSIFSLSRNYIRKVSVIYIQRDDYGIEKRYTICSHICFFLHVFFVCVW